LGIALEPQYQHRGFGKLLMQAALAAAWQHGFRQVSLTVHPENPAITMYEACGFCKQGLRGTYHLMLVERSA
jgi:ribosomal protein S18 acetylase RimI-like enzyme